MVVQTLRNEPFNINFMLNIAHPYQFMVYAYTVQREKSLFAVTLTKKAKAYFLKFIMWINQYSKLSPYILKTTTTYRVQMYHNIFQKCGVHV